MCISTLPTQYTMLLSRHTPARQTFSHFEGNLRSLPITITAKHSSVCSSNLWLTNGVTMRLSWLKLLEGPSCLSLFQFYCSALIKQRWLCTLVWTTGRHPLKEQPCIMHVWFIVDMAVPPCWQHVVALMNEQWCNNNTAKQCCLYIQYYSFGDFSAGLVVRATALHITDWAFSRFSGFYLQ